MTNINGCIKSTLWMSACVGATFLFAPALFPFLLIMACWGAITDLICNHWLPPFPLWIAFVEMFYGIETGIIPQK